MGGDRVIDGYCERVGTAPEFWGEPLNALTNLAFVAAAAWGLALARRGERTDPAGAALAASVLAIGIGSFLFHTLATPWAAAADIISIQVFILLYFAVVLRRAYRLARSWAAAGALAFIPAAALLGRLLRDTWLGGANAGYIAALALMAGNAAILGARGHRLAAWLLGGAGLFAASLALRILDERVCAAFPWGTHFAWHILNGAVLALLLTGLARHGAPAPGGR